MELEKGGIWQTPFYFFRSPTRMGDLRKYGHHPTVILYVDRSFSVAKKRGPCHMFLKTF
jgi:hypothetical protein